MLTLATDKFPGFPINGGIREYLPADDTSVVDNVFVSMDDTKKFRIQPYATGTYHPSWILNSIGDKTSLLQAIVNHADVETIVIDKPFTVSGALSVPVGKKLVFKPGGSLTVNGSLSGGIIEASYLQQIFSGSGLVNPSGVSGLFVSVKWFGAMGSGSVNDQPAIQKAADTLIRNNHLPRTLYFPHGTYRIDSALFFYKWTGTDYSFFSLNLLGQEAAYFNNTLTEAKIEATHVDTFAIGYQMARSSSVKGLVIQGQFSPPGSGDYAAYVARPYSTWASAYGVRDNQTSPYSGIVLDPVDNSNTLGSTGRYPGMSAMYRGTGNNTNSGCSGIKIEQCRINSFTVDIAVSLNSITSNCENVHIIDCTLETAKAAVAYGQDQTKDNYIIRCISWERVHTAIDTANYGRGTGQPPYVDGWNIAGEVIQLWQISPLRAVTSFRNVFAESLWRIGDGDAGAGLSLEASTINFDLRTQGTGLLIPDNHLTGSKVTFKNCVIKYYDNLYDKRMKFTGADYVFEDCELDGMPLFNPAYGYERLTPAQFKNCVTGHGTVGRPYAKGYYTPSSPLSYVAYGKMTFEEGGLLQGSNYGFVKDLRISFDCAWPCKETRLGGFLVTVNGSNRTAVISGLLGSNVEYLLAVNDYITTEEGLVLGKVTAVNRGAGTANLSYVPVGAGTGNYNLINHWVETIAGQFVGDITSNSNVITNVDFDTFLAPVYVGQRLKVGHSFLSLVVDAIGANTITMSKVADYTATNQFNPWVSIYDSSQSFEANTLALAYAANWPFLIPEKAKLYTTPNNYNDGSDVDIICTKAGYLNPSGISKSRLADFRVVGNIKPISVAANTVVNWAQRIILVNTASGNITITPTTSVVDHEWIIVKTSADANTVIIDPSSGNIDGAPTKVLTNQYETAYVFSDGTNVHTITKEASTGATYTFGSSLSESGGSVTLDNDNNAPGNSMYYGTDGSGTKGFFGLPSGGGLSGLTAGRIPYATSTTAISDDSALLWDSTDNIITATNAILPGKAAIGLSGLKNPALDILAGVGTGAADEAAGIRLRHSATDGNTIYLSLGTSNAGVGGNNNGYAYLQAGYWGGTLDNPILINNLGGGVGIGPVSALSDFALTTYNKLAIKAPGSAAGALTGKLIFTGHSVYTHENAFIAGISDGASWINGTGLVFCTVAGSDVSSSVGEERMRISSDGKWSFSTTMGIASTSTILYYNAATGAITYATAPPKFPTKSTHTSGATVTISNQTNNAWLIVNPASTLATLTITLMAAPVDGQLQEISFGGTLTSGTVVTALTISPNSGHTIIETTSPTTAEVGETIAYRFNSSTDIWYRIS